MAKVKAKKVVAIDKVAKPTPIVTTVKEFVTALTNSVVESKKTIPALSHVRIVNQTMYGTDLDLATIIHFVGTGDNDFMLPRKAALDVLKGENGVLTLTPINPEGESRRVKLEVGGLKFELDTLATTNFPEIPRPAKVMATISDKCMRALLDRTLFAISQEESRYTLNGALLTVENGAFRMVATDGHRLSVATSKGKGAVKDTLIANAGLKWLDKHCKGDISFGMDETHHTILTNDGILLSRKLNGQFPNWEQVMLKDVPIVAAFHSNKEVLDKIKRIAKCADERSGAIRISFKPDGATISASSSERGNASGDVACTVKGIEKGNVDIGFNSDYWVDVIRAFGEETFTVGLVSPERPAHLKAEGFDHVIMPMRL